jgi:hypothetical protein
MPGLTEMLGVVAPVDHINRNGPVPLLPTSKAVSIAVLLHEAWSIEIAATKLPVCPKTLLTLKQHNKNKGNNFFIIKIVFLNFGDYLK